MSPRLPLAWFRSWPLRRQARLGACLLIALLAMAVAEVWVLRVSTQWRQDAGGQMLHTAREMSDRLSHEMAARAREVQLLSRTDLFRDATGTDADIDAIRAELERLRASLPTHAWIGVTNAEGSVIAATDNVLVGQSRVINFDKSIGRFSVSNPEIAEAVLVAPDQVLVNGKAFGQVNFIAWEQTGGEFLVFDVYVRANLSLIDSQIRALFPKDDIRLSQANGSVVMSGSVRDAKTVGQAQSVIEAAGFKTVNMLESPVKNIQQVQLQVRVIALENLLLALLSEASDRQLELVREMATYISPRPGFTPHPLTINAASQMVHLAQRARLFRDSSRS